VTGLFYLIQKFFRREKMHATRKDRNAIVLRMLIICMLAATFLNPLGSVPAKAQSAPYISAHPYDGDIYSFGWQSNSSLTLTIDDPATLENPDYTESIDSTDGSVQIYPNFNFSKSGLIISLTDGSITKSMTVHYFEIQVVAYSSGTISGIGDPHSTIDFGLSTASDLFYSKTTIVDESGNWQVDFSENNQSPFDFGSTIIGSSKDDENNPTMANYQVRPFMVARLNNNRILCRGWEPDKTLTLTIDDPETTDNPDVTKTTTTFQDLEHFTLSRADFKNGLPDFKAGLELTLSDGYFSRSMTIVLLTLDIIDPVNDLLSGTTSPNAQLNVMVDQLPNEHPSQSMIINADASGNWTADFKNLFDLDYLTEGTVRFFVNDGSYNHTRIEFQVVPDLAYETVSASEGGEIALDDGSAVITVPPEALAQDTVLTIAPQGTDLQVTTDLGAVQPAVNVNIGPNGTIFASPVTITLTWPDEDNDGFVDGLGLAEADLYVFKDGAKFAGPCSAEASCDQINNTYTILVTSLSDFVVGKLIQVSPSFESLTGPLTLIQVGKTAQVSATVTNPPAGTYSVSYNWGDGSTSTYSFGGNSFSASHAYTTPGIYPVEVTLSGIGFEPVVSVFNSIIVYDPKNGLVTGAGWFMSPAGAYQANPNLTGKVVFAFASKYLKGISVPIGVTDLQFRTAGFNFLSLNNEWLVVNLVGKQAQYKGQGVVNGRLAPTGKAYKFMVWATDGKPDTFRIKIWWEDSSGEHLVYDNGVNQTIGGGSIVIQP